MASNYPTSPDTSSTGSGVDSAKRKVTFLLHTGALCPFRVEVCLPRRVVPMVKEKSNIWSCDVHPPYKQFYCYGYYLHPDDQDKPSGVTCTPFFQSLGSHYVRHDTLFHLPTAYFSGLVCHLQDIYDSIREDNITVKLDELDHILYPETKSGLELVKSFPVTIADLKANALLLWIICSLRAATSPCQLMLLTVLVAHLSSNRLRSGLDVFQVFDNDDLQKLISSLHKHSGHLFDRDWNSMDKLKIMVQKVLEARNESHWLYLVLYCYPFFDSWYVLDLQSKSTDKPPSRKCISDEILPRLNGNDYTERKLCEEAKKLLERDQKVDTPLDAENLTTDEKKQGAPTSGETDSKQAGATSSDQGTVATPDQTINWKPHSFRVLLETDKVTEVCLQIYEEGCGSHKLEIPMKLTEVECKLEKNQKWWKASVEMELPVGPQYKYKYVQTLHMGFTERFTRFSFSSQSTSKEPKERKLQSSRNEDIFKEKSSSQDSFIGVALHEVLNSSTVTNENLVQLLGGDHASTLNEMKDCNRKHLKTVQSHIIELISSSKSDAQVVFLSRLLGNCSLKKEIPCLKNIAKKVLFAFHNCKQTILPFLQQKGKNAATDLINIIVGATEYLQGSWLHLVFYTFPAVSAKYLCWCHGHWKSDSKCKLAPVPREEILSICCKICDSKDTEQLLRLVVESIIRIDVLLQVLKQHGQSSPFQDPQGGYKPWVKVAIQRQIQSAKHVEDIHEIWKLVAGMNICTLELLTRELVLESLAHSVTWSKDATNFLGALFSDETFWETAPSDTLARSFLMVLVKILKLSNKQAGVDMFLMIVTKKWVTRWSSLETLEKLVGEAFKHQLQNCPQQPVQNIHKMYKFLGTLQSVRWFEMLPKLQEDLDKMAMNFIRSKDQLGTLLEMVFNSSKDDTKITPVEMEQVMKHAIMTVKNSKMTPQRVCKLMTPYTQEGQIDIHSECAADVVTAFIDTLEGDEDDVLSILDNCSFWKLIFQASGTEVFKLHCHERCKAVIKTLSIVEHSFLDMSVTVQFVSSLSNSGSLDDLLWLCQIVTYHPDVESANKRDDSFPNAPVVIQTHKKRLDQFEGFFNFYKKFPNNAFETEKEIMKKEVHQRYQDVEPQSDVCLKSLLAESYWGVLEPILDTANKVETIKSSKVFFNICLQKFELESVQDKSPSCSSGTLSDDDTNEEEVHVETTSEGTEFLSDDDTNEEEENVETTSEGTELQVVAFAKLVSMQCLPMFAKLSQDIACGCHTVSVGDIRCMFDGVKQTELNRELDEVSRFVGKQISDQSKGYLKSWVKLEHTRQNAKQLKCLFRTFEVPDKESCTLLQNVDTVLTILDMSNAMIPLQKAHQAIKRIEEVDEKFTDEDWLAISELIHSELLIKFLKPIIDDDLRNLTDAVEERSDSFVNESTVSDLIEVQRYMGSFLRLDIMDTPEKLISAITESKKLGIKKISEKIKTCNDHFHALKNLYNNIAQRGEMTKKIIQNALLKGTYKFVLKKDDEVCDVSMSYTREDDTLAIFQQDELNDLRSRALLMVNSRMSYQPEGQIVGQEEGTMSSRLQKFIYCIDEVNEIVELCSGLANAGHYNFKCFNEDVTNLENLLILKRQLDEDYQLWINILKDARSKFFFLNFFHSKQLLLVDQFFRGESVNIDIINLFHYVSSGVCVNGQLREHYKEPADIDDVKARITATGEALDDIFTGAVSIPRDITCLDPTQTATVDNTVQPGNVFVAELDTNSTNSIPVLMTLLKNTTGKYPQANHVLFCHSETTWEEVHLLLQRCRNSPQRETSALYALINVECLTTEIQFMMVDEVKELQQEDIPFLLAIICRGGCHHHIIDQFSPHFTHQIQGMTANEMTSCLVQGWPEVEVITSEVPGLGKSEYVACSAAEKGKNAVLFEVGGPLTKTNLVRQLLQKPLSDFQVLHVDIRPTSDPSMVDSFIFEALVVGMVVAGTHLCELKCTEVFIEIANTQQNHLRNSLTNCSNFKRHHIEWDNYSSFLVSNEINSSVQVVCHYLKAIKDGSLDSREINLTGSSKEKVLSGDQCRQLLKDHFSPTSKMAFTTVNMFLNVLAAELKKMSASQYFTIDALHNMLGMGQHCVRSDLLKALDNVAQEFSARSVESSGTQPLTGRDAVNALSEVNQGPSVTAEKMVERVKGMVQWADSNHLMVVFNQQDTQTCSTIYRLRSQVPESVKNLFENQLNNKLPDYQNMKQDQLQRVLERICRDTRDTFQSSKLGHLETTYALTPDNMMKMVLIHMRLKSRVPVVIMGETGCGKTTLITYLARICEVPFHIQNFHAGVSKQTILDFICKMKEKAEADLDQQIWCFLDEINTCDHLGLLSEVICHQKCLGNQLPYNLVFLAACNPYSLRKGKTSTTGLSGKLVQDEQSKLVYRVHPLPEALMDYVWDYGSLNAKDEEAYTQRMVNDVRGDLVSLFVDLLIMSQNFIKNNMESKYCVSLRDINRCKYLANWMTDMLKQKGLAKLHHHNSCSDVNIRAIILALAHCYHSRITSADDRKRYREEMAQIFQKKDHRLTEDIIEEVIRKEQLDILNRMELEEGTAKNEALRENVFVVLISILNRIPVFLVGKPGCSKSLSMQLIRSNLRGPDSKDKYFKTLPAVYVVSYQGSESSTSEGIIKVFEKAKRYKEHNPDIIPVVLLDEIGLAENSSFNPLKVLHNLLEPSTGDFPEMAVVGISNWALDAAKMNRAVHLSRPEPNAEDLFETAKSIRDESVQGRGAEETDGTHQPRNDQQLKKLAKAYHEYQNSQLHANFHGLRDYYSLIKSMAMPPRTQAGLTSLESGLRRNFGGVQSDMPSIINNFMDALNVGQHPDQHPTTLDLIKDNLEDKHARHLMLITTGDSAFSIIQKILQESNKRHIILLGSRFDDDISEEYNYRMLSKIILCMEEGYVLVLRDLDNVYCSLYDMLNQNYTFVGKKRHCRVALGAYSNPMCQVHQDFRCIVVIDQQNVDYSDPPLLNRFEKQTLTFMDIVSDEQKLAIDTLREWVESISTVENMQFSPSEAFMGFHSDTLPSLVSFQCQERDTQNMNSREIADLCKNDLMRIASADAVLRSSKSRLASSAQDEVMHFQKMYLKLPLNGGLKHFLEDLFSTTVAKREGDGFCVCPHKLVVYTYSTIHVDLVSCLDGLMTAHTAKLSQYKSERQLTEALQRFNNSDDEMFILQCKTSLDAQHILLAKCLIDNCMTEYAKAGSCRGLKHACIVVHMERDQNVGTTMLFPWQFNFLCGWQQVTLDTLEQPKLHVNEVIKMSIADICAKTVDIVSIIKDKLLWCFSCISYEGQSKDVTEVLRLIRSITDCPELLECFARKILSDIQEEAIDERGIIDEMSWHVAVACEHELLFECASFILALIEHVKRRIGKPLFKMVFFLEERNAWSSFLYHEECRRTWVSMFMNPSVFDVQSSLLPEPKGVESCKMERMPPALDFPFFHIIYNLVEEHMKCLLTEAKIKLVAEHSSVYSDVIATELTQILRNRLPEAIAFDMSKLVEDSFLTEHLDLYLIDLCNVFSSKHVSQMRKDVRVNATKLLVEQQVQGLGQGLPANTELSNWHVALAMNTELLVTELQVLHIYQQATENDPADLLMSISDPFNQGRTAGCFGLQNKIDSEDVEQSVTPEEFLDSLDEIPDDACSETESFISALESYYGGSEIGSNIEEKEEDSLKSQLVSSVCKALLPTKGLLKKFQSQETWVRFVNNILLSAARLDIRPKELHYLHFCKDFVNLLALPNNLPDDHLVELGQLSSGTDDSNILDSEEILVFVQEIVDFIQETNKDPDSTKHHLFLSKYFGRCLEANVETPLLMNICKSLSTEKGSLIEGSRLVMWLVIRSEIDDIDRDTVYTEVIRDGVNPEKHSSNLEVLDKMLQSLPDGVNAHFTTLCCDLIEECGFSNLTRHRLTSGSSPEVMTTLMRASRVLCTSCECSLQLVCAVAFLNVLLRVFSEIVIENGNTGHFLKTEDGLGLIREIKTLVDSLERCERDVSVQRWVLRYMSQQVSMSELNKLMSTLSKSVEIFQGVACNEGPSSSVIGYSPVNYVEMYCEVRDAFAGLKARDDKVYMKAIIGKLDSDPKHRLALVAVLIDFHYLVATSRDLSDTEKSHARWIIKETEGTNLQNTAWYQLLKRVSAVTDFKGKLQLSRISEDEDVQLASVLMHLAVAVLSCEQPGKRSAFQQIFYPSEALKAVYFPAATKQSETKTACTRTAVCHCGLQFVQSLQHEKHQDCPTCGKGIFDSESSDKSNELGHPKDPTGYSYPPALQSWNTLEETEGISIKSRLIIDFMVHGCLYVASQIFPDRFQEVSLCSVSKVESRLTELWSVLPTILRANPHDASVLLHCIIKEVTPTLTATQYSSTSATDRDSQELEIHQEVEKVLKNVTHSKQQFLEASYAASDKPAESIEYQMQELDNIDGNEWKLLPRSCRQKRQPTLEDLRACFCDHSSQNSESFPFLHLVLSQSNSLKYVGFLPSLVSWNFLVSSYLSHQRARRRYANQKIRCLIDAEPNMYEPWSTFQEAFNKVCDVWTELTGECNCPDVITQESQISECLMSKANEGSTLGCMIRTLQGIQNSFLLKTLEIAATTDCPAISFLIKDNNLTAMSTKPLNQVKERDVISPKIDQCICYHDINTEYGHGTEISYDFKQIEMDVALSTIVNKVILTDGGTFKEFIFADDLYHSSTVILEEVKSKVRQEALPKDVANLVIQGDKRRHGTFTNDLLQSVEVITGLLKRTSGDPEATLENFIHNWSSIITIESPELLKSIKLKHIVALYQQLEVLLSAATIQTLGKEYRAKLPMKSQHEVERFCMDRPPDVVMRFRDILKRFVFRYLRARQDFLPDCKVKLHDLLKDMSRYDNVLPLLHKDTQLCHILCLLEFLDKTVQHMEDKTLRVKRKSTRRAAPSTGAY